MSSGLLGLSVTSEWLALSVTAISFLILLQKAGLFQEERETIEAKAVFLIISVMI